MTCGPGKMACKCVVKIDEKLIKMRFCPVSISSKFKMKPIFEL